MKSINDFVEKGEYTVTNELKLINQYMKELYGICIVDESGRLLKLDFYSFNYINGLYYLDLQRFKNINVFGELKKKGISIEQFISNYIENKIATIGLNPISKQSYFDFAVKYVKQGRGINLEAEIEYFITSKKKLFI